MPRLSPSQQRSAQLYAALAIVGQNVSNGRLSPAQGEALIRPLVAAWTVGQINELVTAAFSEVFSPPARHRSWPSENR